MMVILAHFDTVAGPTGEGGCQANGDTGTEDALFHGGRGCLSALGQLNDIVKPVVRIPDNLVPS